MSYKSGSQRQRAALWGHLFYFAAGLGTSLLIYRISGGFPPTTWAHLWIVLLQINSLWATNGFFLVFPTLFLFLQALLLLLIWGVSLGFVVYEVVMILDAFSVWRQLAFLRQWFNAFSRQLRKPSLARAGQQQTILMQGPALPPVALSTPQPPVAATPVSSPNSGAIPFFSPLSQGILPTPKRDNLVSNTMSPAVPESMRWILRSPEGLAQSGQKPPTEQSLTGNEAEKQLPFDVFEEKTHPFLPSDKQELQPAKDPLVNVFEEKTHPFSSSDKQELPSFKDPANPSQEKIRETFPVLFSDYQDQRVFTDLLGNAFGDNGEDDTLPSVFTGNQESEPFNDLLDNPFENPALPENDPLANPFEIAGLPEDDLLANPFENDEALLASGLQSKDPLPAEDLLANPFEEDEISQMPFPNSQESLPVEDPLANPFEEDAEKDATHPSLRAVRPHQRPADASSAHPSGKAELRKPLSVTLFDPQGRVMPNDLLAKPFEGRKETPAGESLT